jgi:hypothetical protein
MSDAESKEVPPAPDALPKTVDFGKPDAASRVQKDLARTMRQFAARLRRDFAPQIAEDPRKFKKRAVHHLRRSLPPFPGRPPEAFLTRALDFRKEGMEWRRIYPLCIPGHAEMPPAVRRQAESNLRAACRSRRNAAKRRTRRDVIASQRSVTSKSATPADLDLPLTGVPCPAS